MGDITLTNATLTNNDKGYTLKTEAEKKEGEGTDKKPETRARVSYGEVTLKEGGNFVNAEGALDSGSKLTITKDVGTGTAQINGKSTWGTINAQKNGAVTVGATGTLSTDYLEYGYAAVDGSKIDDLVSVTDGGQFTVNKSFTVSSFANVGSFDLSQGKNQYLASGASLTFGKAQAFKQVDDDKNNNYGKIVADGDYHKGTVTLSGYEAEWKAEATTPKTGTEGNADTENQGSWDVTKFGAVTVYNNAQLTISDNKAKTADDLTKHGYSASLSLGSLTLNSTSLKVTPSVKVATLTGFIEEALKKVNDGVADDKTVTVDTSKWTKDDYAKNLENFLGTLTDDQKKKFTASYDESIKTETDKLAIKNITATDATQTITGSDVAIGSITFATVERSIEADTSKVVTSREGEGAGDNTPADRGSVTVDAITQAMGTQTLKIEGNSRVEVGSLSLGNGTLNIKGSNLTWGAYKLFENFDQSGIAKEELTFTDGKLTAADAWKNQVGDHFEIKQNSEGDWMIVAGGTSVEGSGLNVSAKNLVSKIFAGERSTGADTQLINQILSTGASLQEISSMINSVTGLGAISGVKAMTVDFQGYTADMIEHHAATMPKEMGGWWVQPLGARLKTDDLSMGGSAYGYSLDTNGIMGGFDTHLKNGWTIGAAASYQSGDADGEGDVLPVSTDVKNVGLHLWGSRMYGETNVIGTLSYVTTDGDVTMQLGNLELASELKAKALSAGIRAEREFKTGAFTLTPHAGARLSIVDMDDYEIAAGTTKLFDVSEDKATIFEVPVGVTVQTPSFMFQTFEVKPYVDVTLRGRFGDTESSYTLEGSSTTDTIDYDVSGSFVGDLKVGYMSTYKNLNLGMSYGLSAGDAGRQNHAIEATMRVDF